MIFVKSIFQTSEIYPKKRVNCNILNLKYYKYLVLSIEYRVNIKWPCSTKTDWACVGVYINLRFLLCQSVLGQSKMYKCTLHMSQSKMSLECPRDVVRSDMCWYQYQPIISSMSIIIISINIRISTSLSNIISISITSTSATLHHYQHQHQRLLHWIKHEEVM